MRAFSFAFLSHEHAGFAEEIDVPGRSEGGSAGETGGFDAVEEACSPDTVWTVGNAD